MTILYNNVVLQDIVEAHCTPFFRSFQYLVWRILYQPKPPKMSNPNGVLPLVERCYGIDASIVTIYSRLDFRCANRRHKMAIEIPTISVIKRTTRLTMAMITANVEGTSVANNKLNPTSKKPRLVGRKKTTKPRVPTKLQMPTR